MSRSKVIKRVIPKDYFSYENGAITIWSKFSESLDFMVEVINNSGTTSFLNIDLTPLKVSFSEKMCLILRDLIVSKLSAKRWSKKTTQAKVNIWSRLAFRLSVDENFHSIIEKFDFKTLHLIGDKNLLIGRDKEEIYSLFNSERNLFDKNISSVDLIATGVKGSISSDQSKTIATLKLTFNNEYLRQVVRTCSRSYGENCLQLAAYLYLILLVSLRCRNESLQQIRLKDCYQSGDQYYVAMWQAKRNTEDLRDDINKRIPRIVPSEIGHFIEKRKYQLIDHFKNKYPKNKWSDIPLFPRLMFLSEKPTLVSRSKGVDLFDLAGSAGERFRPLIREIRRTCAIPEGENFFGSRDLRIMVASDLASRGFDARSIQLVLHHSSTKTAAIYVDLHFNGLIESISESFLDEIKDIGNIGAILAFQSRDSFGKFDAKKSPKTSRGLIESPTSSGVIDSGSCSNFCQGAPHACYECPFGRFIPFIEANHRAIAHDWELKAIEAENGGRQNAELARTFRRKAKFIIDVAEACESRLKIKETTSV